MSDVKRLNFTVSQFESVVPYASEHGQYVRFADYAKLEAEAQALRDEVAALRARVVIVPERLKSADSISRMLRDIGYDGDVNYHHACEIWNNCLDELARLNGKVVSEGLLRRVLANLEEVVTLKSHQDCVDELRALLGEGNEHE